MVSFAEEVEEILNMLSEATQTMEIIIDNLRKGETPDSNTLADFFIIYGALASKTTELHRTWTINIYLFYGKPTLETIEEITAKLLRLTREYEEVTIKYPRADDIERIILLKTLMLKIKKYTSNIETLLKKLEKEVEEKRTPI